MAKVTWTFQAFEDLDAIADYLSSYSTKHAEYIIDLIIEKGNLLGDFPELGRVVPEANISSIREIIIKKYRVIYSLQNKKQVDIIAVRPSNMPLSQIDFS